MAAFQNSLYISGTVGTAECFVKFENNPRIYEEQFVDRKPEKANDGNIENLDIVHDIDITTPETEKKEKANMPDWQVGFSDHEQKAIEISVNNAYPGDVFRLNYGLRNLGTMPVKITAEIVDDSPGLDIEAPESDYLLYPDDDPFSEDLLITVTEDVSEYTDYSFNIQINYEQWNK